MKIYGKNFDDFNHLEKRLFSVDMKLLIWSNRISKEQMMEVVCERMEIVSKILGISFSKSFSGSEFMSVARKVESSNYSVLKFTKDLEISSKQGYRLIGTKVSTGVN